MVGTEQCIKYSGSILCSIINVIHIEVGTKLKLISLCNYAVDPDQV